MLQMSTTLIRLDDEIVKDTQSRLYSLDGGIEALNESELLHLILG
jgi:DNA repair protein RadC